MLQNFAVMAHVTETAMDLSMIRGLPSAAQVRYNTPEDGGLRWTPMQKSSSCRSIISI